MSISKNTPDLWLSALPRPTAESNKYTRGVVHMVGSATMCGATILAARVAQRAGAGLVRLAVPHTAHPIYSVSLPSCIILPIKTERDYLNALGEKRLTAALIGPGLGLSARTKHQTLQTLWLKLPTVLDADALSVFKDAPSDLFPHLSPNVVLTPHEGEFSRLFDLTGSRVERAAQAATISNAIIVLKGAETVIAAPDGQVAINTNASPDLATAGAGDVLAGLITGLLAQGMPPFLAAAAGVWLHGEAGRRFGPGLIAEDIEGLIPAILTDLQA